MIAVGTLLQVGPYSYITLANPSDPDPKPKDLEGKTLGMQADGDFFLQAFAKQNSVDLSKVKVEIVQANAEPLLVGKVDFFTGWITNQTYQIDQEIAKPDAPPNLKGKAWKAMRYADYGVLSYSDVLFATAKTIKEKTGSGARLRPGRRSGDAVHPRQPGGLGQARRGVPGAGGGCREADLALEDPERAVRQ